MVGEETTSLRKRPSRSGENFEEKEDERKPSEESLGISSNGKVFTFVLFCFFPGYLSFINLPQ